MRKFKNVVIWGHKLGSHTHSFVHNSFFKAFQSMGYNTLWFDDNDVTAMYDFSDSLFLTEGQVDKNIPLRKDCKYILHNCNAKKYESIGAGFIAIQVLYKGVTGEKINEYTYLDGKTLFQPWATDLLPHEIVPIKNERSNNIYFIGSVVPGANDSSKACFEFARGAKTKNIKFVILGGYSGGYVRDNVISRAGFVGVNDAINFTREAYLAPVFQSDVQIDMKYVPCRIFKNISYGQYAITNCPHLKNFFEEEIIYNSNTYDLFFEAEEKKKTQNLEKLIQIVKEKHTFINRINQILEVL
jgi:hypothetical protein